MKITILIVNYNSIDFIKMNLEALSVLMYYSHRIIICDNYYNDIERQKLIKICKEYNNIELIFRKQTSPGSVGHGEALDILIKKVEDLYFVILDADNIFLRKHWDKILLDKMIKEDLKIIGTQASTHGINKNIDFPYMFGMMAETKAFKSLNISMCPNEIYDTGGMMKERFIEAGYKYDLLYYSSTRTFKEGLFKDIICGEYYLDPENKRYYKNNIFCCHFGRGSTLGKAKYTKGIGRYIFNIPIINKYILNKEKFKWLNICRRIIHN